MASHQVLSPKAPNEVKDYAFDFKPFTHARTGATSDLLEVAETITDHTVTVPAGMTLDSSSEADGVVIVWLSGGIVGVNEVTCQIETSAGRVYERTIVIMVEGL